MICSSYCLAEDPEISAEMICRRWPANKITGANSRPASEFESPRLRRCALVVEGHGRYHGGAAVAQFCRWADLRPHHE